jgi:hypothetical protein
MMTVILIVWSVSLAGTFWLYREAIRTEQAAARPPE